MVKSYSQKFGEQIAGKDYKEATALGKLMTRETKDGRKVKNIIATLFGVEVIHTVIFEKK